MNLSADDEYLPYLESSEGSHMACHWRWLVKWAHQRWLLMWKCFPDNKAMVTCEWNSIALSMHTYKPQLMGKGWFTLRVAYQLNYVFRIMIGPFPYKTRGFPSRTYCTFMYNNLHKRNTHKCCCFIHANVSTGIQQSLIFEIIFKLNIWCYLILGQIVEKDKE